MEFLKNWNINKSAMEMNNYSSLFKEKQAMSSKDKLAKPLFKLNAILIVYTEQTLDCNEVPPPTHPTTPLSNTPRPWDFAGLHRDLSEMVWCTSSLKHLMSRINHQHGKKRLVELLLLKVIQYVWNHLCLAHIIGNITEEPLQLPFH